MQQGGTYENSYRTFFNIRKASHHFRWIIRYLSQHQAAACLCRFSCKGMWSNRSAIHLYGCLWLCDRTSAWQYSKRSHHRLYFPHGYQPRCKRWKCPFKYCGKLWRQSNPPQWYRSFSQGISFLKGVYRADPHHLRRHHPAWRGW